MLVFQMIEVRVEQMCGTRLSSTLAVELNGQKHQFGVMAYRMAKDTKIIASNERAGRQKDKGQRTKAEGGRRKGGREKEGMWRSTLVDGVQAHCHHRLCTA
jgi:hypothetical protein